MEIGIELRNRDTGAILTEREFRMSLENISLPAVLGQDVFDRFRVDPVLQSPQPSATEFQYVQRDGVVGDGDGKWFQAWKVVDMSEEAAATKAEEIAKRNREAAKAARQATIDSIVVTVGDKQFDGDEKSQERMLRALKVAEITGLTSTMWTLADNTNVEVTVAEISEALAKAALAQSQVWVI